MLLLCVTLSALSPAPAGAEGLVTEPQQSVRTLVPVGQAVGIKLFSDGVLVVGLGSVDTQDGPKEPGRSCGLKAGDLITHINGQEVDTVEQVQSVLTRDPGAALTIRAQRGSKILQLSAVPAANVQGNYQLGLWLRDSMAGIGTVTFYDPSSGRFAALGHGINDVDTALLMPLESGSILPAQVSDVQKGTPGQPGALHGVFRSQDEIGTLSANTTQGIFGTVKDASALHLGQAVPTARWEELHTGCATILSNVRGEQVEEFQIRITHLSQEDRTMSIEVTDPALLETTGGIVQGMSGSPIIQDGKIVGAVTHVLVHAPEKGYGTFIKNMLEHCV